MKCVCIVGASGNLGQYMVRHALDRRYEVVGVCRASSIRKLDAFKDRIIIIPGATRPLRSVQFQAIFSQSHLPPFPSFSFCSCAACFIVSHSARPLAMLSAAAGTPPSCRLR